MLLSVLFSCADVVLLHIVVRHGGHDGCTTDDVTEGRALVSVGDTGCGHSTVGGQVGHTAGGMSGGVVAG